MTATITTDQDNNKEDRDTWLFYDTDTLFYIIVVMITFTSIVGTFLFYRDRLLRSSTTTSSEDGDDDGRGKEDGKFSLSR